MQAEFVPEEEIVMGLKSPLGIVSSDGGGLVDGTGHPRSVATYAEPDQRSAGIPFVIVNGVMVVEDGVVLEEPAPGQWLRHPAAGTVFQEP